MQVVKQKRKLNAGTRGFIDTEEIKKDIARAKSDPRVMGTSPHVKVPDGWKDCVK